VSDDEISRVQTFLAQEPAQRERAEQLFREVLRAAGEFKNKAAQASVGPADLMVEMEKLEEALLFFKGLSNRYYDLLYQLHSMLQERKLAPAAAIRLLEKRTTAARSESR
jgi:predicted translin family RNA/ssDNA-binding protein